MLVLVRDVFTENSIFGRLYFCGQVICNTLENRSKAIPKGTYTVQNSQSPKFKRELPLIWNSKVPAKRGVRVHRGNDAVKDSQGCVLVGMKCDEKRLVESSPAEIMVTMLCRSDEELIITSLDSLE